MGNPKPEQETTKGTLQDREPARQAETKQKSSAQQPQEQPNKTNETAP